MIQKIVYTVKEMAQMLNIGLTKAYEIVNQNLIPNKKIGKRILIPHEALMNWLNNN